MCLDKACSLNCCKESYNQFIWNQNVCTSVTCCHSVKGDLIIIRLLELRWELVRSSGSLGSLLLFHMDPVQTYNPEPECCEMTAVYSLVP